MFYDTSSFIKPAPALRDDRFHSLVMLLPREPEARIEPYSYELR